MQEKKHGFVNNGSYRILEMGDPIKLGCEITKKELHATLDFIKDHLRLCYVKTQASVQGDTIPGRLRVYTNHSWFSKRALYVCTSRCTSSALLEVV